jgi:hypothetical protein
MDREFLEEVVKGNAKTYRKYLTSLSNTFQFKHALELIELRSKTELDISTDDVNILLNGIVFKTSQQFYHGCIQAMREAGFVNSSMNMDEIKEECVTFFESYDMSDCPDAGNTDPSQEIYRENRDKSFNHKKRPRVSENEVGNEKKKRNENGEGVKVKDKAAIGQEISLLYKQLHSYLKEKLPSRVCKVNADEEGDSVDLDLVFEKALALKRLNKVVDVFEYADSKLSSKVPPNARTFVLLLKACYDAKSIEKGQSFLSMMINRKLTTVSELAFHMQPIFLKQLQESGILKYENQEINAITDCLSPPIYSTLWCFLIAARRAYFGDQNGSKHGAVIINRTDSNNPLVVAGNNHRYYSGKDPQAHVMHAEIHCLVQMYEKHVREKAKEHVKEGIAPPASAAASPLNQQVSSKVEIPTARHSDVWVIELDNQDVGYEEGVPCPMCQTGLCAIGLANSWYSSHTGPVKAPITYRPALVCETIKMSTLRSYTAEKGLKNPDMEVSVSELDEFVKSIWANSG